MPFGTSGTYTVVMTDPRRNVFMLLSRYYEVARSISVLQSLVLGTLMVLSQLIKKKHLLNVLWDS